MGGSKVYPEGSEPASSPSFFDCWCIACLCRKHEPLNMDEKSALEVVRKALLETKEGNESILSELLTRAWKGLYPDDTELPLVSDKWKMLGFQSSNPGTDVRTGLFPMRSVVYFIETYPKQARDILSSSQQPSSEYPFAACAFNVSVSLHILSSILFSI